jgi:Glycosyl hydrolase family 10
MGRIRFHAPGCSNMLTEYAARGYMAGLEGLPWVTRCVPQGDYLLVDREVNESGVLCLPWRVSGYGELMLSTTTMMERDEAYHLPLELARGTVHRLKSQLSNWQLVGLKTPLTLDDKIHHATQLLAKAATRQNQPEAITPIADKAIQAALDAIDDLCEIYGDQALALRLQAGPVSTLIGCRLDHVPEGKAAAYIVEAFNAVHIPFSWREIESEPEKQDWEKYDRIVDWAREQGLKICGGPLLFLDQRSLPDWIYVWEEDWDELEGYILNHVTSVVNRYKGKIHLWNVAGRVNAHQAISVDEEQMLRLVVDTVEKVRHSDTRIPIVVSFNQPWSETMGLHDRDLPPLQFADTLARAELGVAGFGLEIQWGYWPNATPERDLIELSRLIDRWTMLGFPLLMQLVSPSSSEPDPLARQNAKPIGEPGGKRPSVNSQMQAMQKMLPVLLAKSSVQALFWNQWSDGEMHEYSHGGLLDATGKPKPVLKVLADMRRKMHVRDS